ncbi:MAG TPA: glycoside hydrolase family 76 protein [Bryobacteraceae bacterium]|nr:glycoside hydrolase family 76 protein [Bryobacteraceae bacterium]
MLTASSSYAQPADTATTDLTFCAKAGVEALQKWYAPETGLWQTTNWWNAANAITALVRYSTLNHSSALKSVIENTFDRNSAHKFLNKFYDDEGWWALAWLDAYEWTHDARYLEVAEQIFADMAAGWDETCGGGIWWNKDKRYKNAIANELFLSVAARLAGLAREPERRASYLEWAGREWKWFAASGMINAQNLVNDGLDAACRNNGRTTWSYNQGVVLGGLVSLSTQTADSSLRDRAQSIALAAILHLTDENGILHDRCEPNCGNDAVQFKGIFSRNLAVLYSAIPSPKVRVFLDANAQSICHVQTAEHQFGVVWSRAASIANAATQVSALDAIFAAIQVASTPRPVRIF